MLSLGLMLAALVTKSMTGHAAGQTSHEAATSAMIVHLVAAGVWLGGLALLVLLSGRLGAKLPAAAERFSALHLPATARLSSAGSRRRWSGFRARWTCSPRRTGG